MPKKNSLKVNDNNLSNNELSDSDNENTADENVDDNVDDNVEEIEDEDKDLKDNSVEKKKKKLDINDHHKILFSYINNLSVLNDELKDLRNNYLNKVKTIQNKQKNYQRLISKITKIIPKSLENSLAKARKEKRHRKGPNNGGFVKVKKVPKKLEKYLGLKSGTELTRPKVIHLINEKFKNDNLRNGKRVILDKETSKFFGKKNGYIIEFSGLQTFVADLYKEELSKVELSI
jgi:hypothetical protein